MAVFSFGSFGPAASADGPLTAEELTQLQYMNSLANLGTWTYADPVGRIQEIASLKLTSVSLREKRIDILFKPIYDDSAPVGVSLAAAQVIRKVMSTETEASVELAFLAQLDKINWSFSPGGSRPTGLAAYQEPLLYALGTIESENGEVVTKITHHLLRARASRNIRIHEIAAAVYTSWLQSMGMAAHCEAKLIRSAN